jgi:hypothetical protein
VRRVGRMAFISRLESTPRQANAAWSGNRHNPSFPTAVPTSIRYLPEEVIYNDPGTR